MTPLHAFLSQDVLTVAPALLGCELISRTPEGEAGGRIVEAEAYQGAIDPASHAYRGLTPRTAPMFAGGGTIYIYLSYGLHTCLNIVTGPAGKAQAVLIRALEPTTGLGLMARRRGTDKPRLLTSGPGRVGQALGLNLTQSGQPLGQTLELRHPAAPLDPALIMSGPRIGIRQAVDRPWRFWLMNNPHISR
jgi:DNA-3-methyladenine glycosylase